MASYEPQTPSHSSSSTSSKQPINLLRGWPNPSLLPTTLIRSAAQSALSDPSISKPGLLYGPDQGYQPLRESIAEWLTSFYQPRDSVAMERVCITGGASQNLGSIMNVYTDPSHTRAVWIVAPAYFLAFRIFEDAGLEMRAVPEDEQGLDISFLRREMEKVNSATRTSEPKHRRHSRPWTKVYRHIIYCVSTFANPSSRTLTLARRKDLVRLARDFDALVISDDVYDFLQFPADKSPRILTTAHLPRLVDIDRTLPGLASDGFGNTASNGSFSKIVGPGMRVGWCEGTPKFAYGVSQAGTTKSGGAPSQLTSTYVNIMLERGELQGHIQGVLLPAYRRRYESLVEAVERYLVPLGFALPRRNQAMEDVQGGYFTWLTLPSALTPASEKGISAAEQLSERCLAEENVIIAAGKMFEVPGDCEGVHFGGYVRLCWSWEHEEMLEEGVRRIARVAEGMRKDELQRGYVLVEKSNDDPDTPIRRMRPLTSPLPLAH